MGTPRKAAESAADTLAAAEQRAAEAEAAVTEARAEAQRVAKAAAYQRHQQGLAAKAAEADKIDPVALDQAVRDARAAITTAVIDGGDTFAAFVAWRVATHRAAIVGDVIRRYLSALDRDVPRRLAGATDRDGAGDIYDRPANDGFEDSPACLLYTSPSPRDS